MNIVYAPCNVRWLFFIYLNELLRHGPINPTPNNRQTARMTVLAELDVDLREEMSQEISS